MNHLHDTTNDTESPALPPDLSALLEAGLDVKLHLLAHYAELARLLAREILDEEVMHLVGPRYSREKPHGGRYRRWGSNPGSIQLGEERVPVQVPRVRDVVEEAERPLESYRQMKRSVEVDAKLEEAILLGLSQRDYGRVAGAFIDGFGLSQSSVSRRFQERSRAALEAFEARRLDTEDFLTLWIDGKTLASQQIVICLGLTLDGRKLPLGFVETTTENGEAIKGLLQDLLARGLDFREGLLCIIDGAKGLRSAIDAVFGEHAQVQRCQWHKRENVVSYLRKSDQESYRRKLQRAYEKPTYEAAKKALMRIHAELEGLNRSAARSLMEGLEETLTVHRLGLFVALGRSLKTTNCIENLNGQLGRYLGKVKRWMTSDQRHRWVALGLLEAEQRMRRIDHYEHLPKLREALQRELEHHRRETTSEDPLAEASFN